MAVPKLRFPEFTDDWEQRKLGSISEIKTGPFGSTLHADDYVTDGIPIITTEHFKNGDLPTSKNGLPQVSDEDYKRLSSYVLNEGDIVFSRVGSVDINALVMLSQRHWLFSGRVLRVRPDMVNDPQFLHTVLETETIKADIRSRAVGQTMPSINTEILNETLVMMPQLRTEQEQIGQFFYSLNKTITLHQRKLDDIKLLKKSMLQKMFPAEGRDVPEVRFPGFTAAWEQRKLGDLYTERNERGNGSLQILSVSIHTGVSDGELDVDNLGKFVRRSEDKSTYKHVHSGDLIFNMMRAWQGAIGVAKTEGMISPAYISAIPSEDIYPPFMNYLLRRKDVINQINNLSYGVTDSRKRLYWNSFVQVNCKLPSVEEQRNITDVFEKIDHLITLHQSELEKLQKIKKSLLERMFV